VLLTGPSDFVNPLAGVLQIEHNSQRGVNAPQLFEAEITHAVAEATGIDRRGLFGQHPRDLAIDLDFGPKACGPS
jgi:hypothetical protein